MAEVLTLSTVGLGQAEQLLSIVQLPGASLASVEVSLKFGKIRDIHTDRQINKQTAVFVELLPQLMIRGVDDEILQIDTNSML